MQNAEEKFRVYKLKREVDRVADECGLLMARIMHREGKEPGTFSNEQLWHSFLFTWQSLDGCNAETSEEFLKRRAAGTGLDPDELKEEVMEHLRGFIRSERNRNANVEGPETSGPGISSFTI